MRQVYLFQLFAVFWYFSHTAVLYASRGGACHYQRVWRSLQVDEIVLTYYTVVA